MHTCNRGISAIDYLNPAIPLHSMNFSTLVSLLALSHAAATPEDDSVQVASLDTAVDIAETDSPLEKRTLFLLAKAKYLWASALLNKGICYACGSQNLGCGGSCCRCGSATRVSCSTC